jgi:hypothetical protein
VPGSGGVQVRGLRIVHVGEADECGQGSGYEVTLADETAGDALVFPVAEGLRDPLAAQAVLGQGR